MQKSDNRLVTYAVIGRAAVAFGVAAAYVIATLPGGFGAGYGSAMTWFAIIEALLTGVACLHCSDFTSLSLRFRIRAIDSLGFWFYATEVVSFVLIIFGLSSLDAIIFGVKVPFFGTMDTKVFCLSLMVTMTVFEAVVRFRKNEVVEEEAEPEPEIATAAEAKTEIECISNVTIKEGSDIHIVDISDIIYIKAEGDYVNIVTETGSYLKEQTMKYFTEALPKDKFVRIHRSYIINTAYLRSIERYGEYQMVLMAGGEKIRISASGYRILKDRIGL